MKNVEYEKYLTFYKGLGPVLKEGLARDWDEQGEDRRPAAVRVREHGGRASSPRWPSTSRRCRRGRTDIYYLTGESAEQLRHSPYLEAFRAKGYDVLLLTDPIDEFAMP